jgi:regulator of replication initiation timing
MMQLLMAGVMVLSFGCNNSQSTIRALSDEVIRLREENANLKTENEKIQKQLPKEKSSVKSSGAEPFSIEQNSTLSNFDMNLDMVRFKETYKEQIESCSEKEYNSEVTTKYFVPYTSCKFKNGKGRVEFYDLRVIYFVYYFDKSEIALHAAVDKMNKKTGRAYKIQLFIDNAGRVTCSAGYDFLSGEVNLISEVVFCCDTSYICSEKDIVSKDLKSIRYDNTSIQAKRDQDLLKLKVTKETEAAKDIQI